MNLWTFDQEKFSAYECGFDPFEDTRLNFDIRFYLVAIFFIIFDLEVIFFFPLTLALPFLSFSDFALVIIFVFFLFIGVIYEFWSGKLDWSLLVLKCAQFLDFHFNSAFALIFPYLQYHLTGQSFFRLR
jgi:NADH:ubiquinone oxidoreductase subunit 3 (subunit A)